MQFSGWTTFPPEVRDAELNRSGEGRPSGLHLSEIISYMRELEGLTNNPIDDATRVRFIEGFLWEVALEYQLAGVPLDEALQMAFKRHMVACRENISKQIKLEKDGIHMTPDGLDDAAGVLESYKMTRKSFKKAMNKEEFEQHFWTWIVQEASYCWAAGVDTARWIVLFQNGDYTDYKGPGTSDPKILTATATWTLDELASNWNNVLTHAEAMKKGQSQLKLF